MIASGISSVDRTCQPDKRLFLQLTFKLKRFLFLSQPHTSRRPKLYDLLLAH